MTRRLHPLLASLALASATFAAMAPASPAQDRYAGTWTIASSEPAPWPHKADWEDPPEIKQLTGATVTIRADRIDGPHQVACRHPHYEIRMDAADMLFQGSLEESGDKSTTPDKAATALGFAKRPIATLVTGCANELELHAIDDDHLLFGLNNRVYRMTRTQPAPAKGGKP